MSAILSILSQLGRVAVQNAAEVTTDDMIKEIHARIAPIPTWGFKFILALLIVTTLGVIMIWKRQTKIARNQVQIAEFLKNSIRD